MKHHQRIATSALFALSLTLLSSCSKTESESRTILTPAEPPSAVDLVLRGGTVATVDVDMSEAEAIAVRGHSIVAVGSDQTVAGVLAVCAIAALVPTVKPRATGKVVGLVERNYDLWMRQNKISGYSRRTSAFLLKAEDAGQAEQFHDPVCDECWHESEALFNIDENRVLRQADVESGARVQRQSVSQLDLADYYWARMSLSTALTLYVTFREVTEAALVD